MEQAAAVRATREAHPPRRAHSELVYGIEDVPPLPQTLFAALQHMLAMFVAIITPPLIIANALGLPAADTRYIVSMSLVMSGIASFIQTRRFGPLGSGLLSVQGTSFNFLGPSSPPASPSSRRPCPPRICWAPCSAPCWQQP